MTLRIYRKAISSGMAFAFSGVLAVMLLIVFTGCGGRDERGTVQTDQTSEMRFRIDDDLLSPPITYPELGIVMQPPANWNREDVPLQADLPIEPLGFFVGDGPSYLLVGALNTEDTAESVAESLATGGDGEQTDFLHNGIHFFQIRRVAPENVSFLIIFDTPNSEVSRPGIIQFVIPPSNMKDRARIVESSLGSVLSSGETP